MTTGAITGVVDRLVRAGGARRALDPHDRRRVIVRLLPEKLEQQVAPLLQAAADLSADFNEEELSRIIDFIASSTRLLRDDTARLRTERGEGMRWARRGRRPTPLGKDAPRRRRRPPRFR